MQIRGSHKLLKCRSRLVAGLGLSWVLLGAGLGRAQEPTPVTEGTPIMVNDDGEVQAVLLPEGGASDSKKADRGAEAAPIAPPAKETTGPAGGLKSESETVRKAIPEPAKLLDPTAPTLEETSAMKAPGSDPSGNPLLPPVSAGGAGRASLAAPETSSTVKPVEPIMGSAPFSAESKPDGGPVVLGTDLEPDGGLTALAPDQTAPEFLDGPIVDPTDPWVFSVEVASVFDDNIRLSGSNAQQDFLFVMSASIAWQWGDVRLKRGSYARAFYEATAVGFAEESEENSVDHDVQAAVQKRAGRLSAMMEGRYRRLSGATPDLGDRVERDDYHAKLGGSYDLSGRTFVEAQAGWSAVRYHELGLADYDEFLGELFAGYEVSGRTKVSGGGAVGQLRVAGTDPQNFQRALVKVTRASTGALGLTGKAGAEFRQTSTGKNVTPVFALAADYEPIEDSTRVTAEVFRETVASGALAGENYLRTGGALRLTQRLGSRFVAGLEAGYEQLDYAEATSGVQSGRSDDYFFAKPSMKYEFNSRRRAEVFYSLREDESSLEDFSFTANQWGLSFGLDF